MIDDDDDDEDEDEDFLSLPSLKSHAFLFRDALPMFSWCFDLMCHQKDFGLFARFSLMTSLT